MQGSAPPGDLRLVEPVQGPVLPGDVPRLEEETKCRVEAVSHCGLVVRSSLLCRGSELLRGRAACSRRRSEHGERNKVDLERARKVMY